MEKENRANHYVPNSGMASVPGTSSTSHSPTPLDEQKRKWTLPYHSQSFRLFIRISVIFSLLITAVVVGVGSFLIMSNLQDKVQRQQYYAITRKIESSTMSAILDKQDALTSGVTLALQYCPNESDWPLCGSLPFDFYQSILNPLHRITQTRSIATSIVVQPSEVDAFENFAYQFYADQGHSDLGISPFGRGIFMVNSTKQRYHDTIGGTIGKRNILMPILQVTDYNKNKAILMYNTYVEKNRVQAIDTAMDCVEKVGGASINCTAITGIIFLIQDQGSYIPSSLTTLPIVPVNSTKVVGVVSAVHNWDKVLNLASNEKVNGIVAILSDGTTTHAFRYENGEVKSLKPETTPPNKYKDQTVVFEATPFGGPIQYTVELYPTDEWMALYSTDVPLISCLIMVALVLFTSLAFYLYDFLMNREAVHKDLVMKTKRQYVRYISHEVRTPLNVVHLGFQVLYTEMKKMQELFADDKLFERRKEPSIVSKVVNQASDWVNLVNDMVESLNAAITVLNDLIDYDKIDSGTMTLQRQPLPVWSFVESCVHPFEVQARAKDIEMVINLQNTTTDDDSHRLDHLILQGDKVKLSQVFRNLVSNALKFTPVGGRVCVEARWEQSVSKLQVPESNKGWLAKVFKARPHAINPNNDEQFEDLGRIVITVTDTGVGMTKDQVRQLFREGVQFNPNELQAGQGSGLGLWITKGIVSSHGGKLWATSDGEGKGTSFILILPVYEASVTPKTSRRNNDNSTRQAESDITLSSMEEGTLRSNRHSVENNKSIQNVRVARNRSEESDHTQKQRYMKDQDSSSVDRLDDVSTIGKSTATVEMLLESQQSQRFHNLLVTDDSGVNRKMMCRSLQSVGFKCFQASDGQECVDIVKKALQHEHEPIDLVLMDYEMPRMNGPKACSVLRDMRCGIPVIGVTGNVLNEDKRLFMEHGAIHVLQKPFSIQELETVLQQLHKG